MRMKVIYTGKTKDFTPHLEKKVEGKLIKLGKMVDRRGEQEAHLFHRQERHLHMVEVKMNFYDHALSGAGADGDLAAAVIQAVDKLEKQLVRQLTKWRDTGAQTRRPLAKNTKNISGAAPVKAAPASAPKPLKAKAASTAEAKRIFKVAYGNGQKPMSLEEAVLALDEGADYVVYREFRLRPRFSIASPP